LSEKFDNTLICNVNHSTWLAAILVAVHVGAGVLTWLVPMPGAARTVLALALLASLAVSIRHHALQRGRHSIAQLILDEEDRCVVRRRAAAGEEPCEITHTFVRPWLVILALVPQDKRGERLVLPRDCMAADAFRKLRARLRLRNPAA
jgi:hypothetical protein